MSDTLPVRLAAIRPDPSDSAFPPLVAQPALHRQGFPLGGALRVTFDPSKGGALRVAGIVPPLGAAHWRLTPVNLGAADWYAVETDLDPLALRGLESLIPCLDAASPRKLSLFALLRVVGPDGRSHDGSSTMVELGPERRGAVFPVSLSDIPAPLLHEAASARLIFFLEARDVDLDLYGLSVTGIAAPPPVVADAALRSLRDRAGGPPVAGPARILSAATRKGWAGKVTDHAEIAKGVFLGIEPGPGRKVAVSRGWSKLEIDFTAAAASRWRSLEFRFAPFADTGRMVALLRVSAMTAQAGPLPVVVILRHYPGQGVPFRDSVLGAGLMLYPDAAPRESRFDLSPYLPDSTALHETGLMLFFPPDTGLLTVEGIEASLADLSAAQPPAAETG